MINIMIFYLLTLTIFNLTQGEQDVTEYRIPPRDIPVNISDGNVEFEMPEIINGIPIIPQYVTVVTIANRGMLLFPVLMNEPNLPVDVEVGLIDPMQWNKKGVSSHTVARRSMWYMDVKSTMLYSVVIDLASGKPQDIGVGYIVVKRIDKDHYDVMLEDTRGTVLFAGRGKLQRIDEAIGQGTFTPVDNQEMIRKMYNAKWNLSPLDFILFSSGN